MTTPSTSRDVKFWVAGEPITQGSKRIVTSKRSGAPILVEDRSHVLMPWREAVGRVAQLAGLVPAYGEGGVILALEFYLERPPSVSKKRTQPWTRPDIDKLCRAVLDGLTGIAFKDDGRVVRMVADKMWADERGPGLEVRLYRMADR